MKKQTSTNSNHKLLSDDLEETLIELFVRYDQGEITLPQLLEMISSAVVFTAKILL